MHVAGIVLPKIALRNIRPAVLIRVRSVGTKWIRTEFPHYLTKWRAPKFLGASVIVCAFIANKFYLIILHS